LSNSKLPSDAVPCISLTVQFGSKDLRSSSVLYSYLAQKIDISDFTSSRSGSLPLRGGTRSGSHVHGVCHKWSCRRTVTPQLRFLSNCFAS